MKLVLLLLLVLFFGGCSFPIYNDSETVCDIFQSVADENTSAAMDDGRCMMYQKGADKLVLIDCYNGLHVVYIGVWSTNTTQEIEAYSASINNKETPAIRESTNCRAKVMIPR